MSHIPAPPSFTPTTKRRSFRPSSFRPLAAPTTLDALNEDLRASLMSVGMRVRKSVPEGYKTSAKSQFSIYEQTAAAYPELHPLGGFAHSSSSAATDALCPPPVEIGAVMTDEQVEDTVDSVLLDLGRDLSGWDSVAGSQESGISTVSTTSSLRFPGHLGGSSASRKRSVEEEDELRAFEERFASVPMERDAPLRAIAQPRSRRPGARRTSSGKGGQKRVSFALDAVQDDFGEADFLMPDRSWEA